MRAKAGGDAVEITVVVAGMAAEFEGPLRGYGVQDFVEGFAVEVAGGGDSDGAVGGQDVCVADLGPLFEPGLEGAQKFNLQTANAIAMAQSEAPGLFEGMADGIDPVTFREAEQRPENGREEVGVFMSVQVSDLDAGELKLLDLGAGFAFNVVFANFAAQESLNEIDERGTKGFAVGADERGNAFRSRDGDPVGENDVTAYAEGWIGVSDSNCVIEGWASCHQSCGGEGPRLVKLSNGAVDARSQAKVVRVDDQSGSHRVCRGAQYGSLTCGSTCKVKPLNLGRATLRMNVQRRLQWSVTGGWAC